MIRDKDYTSSRKVCMKFVGALNNFLEKKSRELKANVGKILSTFESLCCKMSISVLGVSKHFLPNLVVSDGQNERFHFNIKLVKNIFRCLYV